MAWYVLWDKKMQLFQFIGINWIKLYLILNRRSTYKKIIFKELHSMCKKVRIAFLPVSSKYKYLFFFSAECTIMSKCEPSTHLKKIRSWNQAFKTDKKIYHRAKNLLVKSHVKDAQHLCEKSHTFKNLKKTGQTNLNCIG